MCLTIYNLLTICQASQIPPAMRASGISTRMTPTVILRMRRYTSDSVMVLEFNSVIDYDAVQDAGEYEW